MGIGKINLLDLCNFGDKRLGKRLLSLTDDLCRSLSESVPSSTRHWKDTKGAYRFWDNAKVTPSKQLSVASEGLKKELGLKLESIVGKVRVLQLDDTTELDYTGKSGGKQLGPLNYLQRHGLKLHTSLVVSESGSPLGLLKQTNVVRKRSEFGQHRKKQKLLLKEKETYCWYTHYEAGNEWCKEYENLEVVQVCDREADFMELLGAPRAPNYHFVIRSQYDRCVVGKHLKLRALLATEPIRFSYSIKVSSKRKGGKQTRKRRAKVSVRYRKMEVALKGNLRNGVTVKPVELTAIEVVETNPPKGHEAVHWILLTSLEVHGDTAAHQVIGYYVLRWRIERFFYLLKSGGAQVEELQLQKKHNLLNAIATYSIAAMDAIKLRYCAENEPDKPIEEIGITQQEYRALYTYVGGRKLAKVSYDPKTIPNVREFCIVLTSLVGFRPSKRQPLPGLKRITKSLAKFHLVVEVDKELREQLRKEDLLMGKR